MKKIIGKIIIVLLIIACADLIYLAIRNVQEKTADNENVEKVNKIQNEITNTVENNVGNSIENDVKNSDDLFSDFYEQAEELMKDMTLEEKVGQMFLARYPSNNVLTEIKNENPGGYVLFGRDFDNKTKQEMIDELQENQKASKIGLILGVDEEGGTVVRVSSHKAFRNSKFQSPQAVYKQER